MKLKAQIIRTKRKSLSLKITNDGNLEIHAPLKMKTEDIEQFIKSKSNWINKQLKEVERKKKFAIQFDFQNFKYLLGTKSEKEKNFSYKAYAQQVLPGIAEKISTNMDIKFKSYRTITSKRVWGTFSNKKELSINYKCVILPIQLITYIVIHELCHSKQMNHSPKFWKLVEGYCPKYKSLKKQLNDYAFLLQDKQIK